MHRHEDKTLRAVPNKTLADAAGVGHSAYKLLTKGQHIWLQDPETGFRLVISINSI